MTHESHEPQTLSRRRMLQTLFCSSAMLAMNLSPRRLSAAEVGAKGDLNFIGIGDFGSGKDGQVQVASAMASYVRSLGVKPEALLLLGDNFYGKGLDDVKSPRFRTGFEEMYPKSVFDCPCPVVLGNHDYGDNLNGEKTQLAYARDGKTRWTLPHKWYRMEFPKKDPIVTFLFIDTNSHRTQIDPKTGQPKPSLSHAEEAEQWKWIEKELSSKRAAWTIVVGHHPVYSNGQHGDTKELVEKLAPMLAKHNVPLYLCGHDHDMQHLELEGVKTSFVVSGGGGAKVRELKTPDRKLGLYGEGVNGFSHLQINAQRMVIRHMDPSGKQIHAFEKKPDGSFSIMNA